MSDKYQKNISDLKSYSKLSETKYYLKGTLAIIRNYIKLKIKKNKFKRVPKFVQSKYDSEVKNTFFKNETWKKSKNLEHFCYIGFRPAVNENSTMYALIENRLVHGLMASIYEFDANKQMNTFKKFVSVNDEIVELGCGIGRRLFFLRSKGWTNKLEGFDISDNLIQTGQKINEYFDCNIYLKQANIVNHLDPNIIKNKIVFTSHALEQIKYSTEDVIRNILEGKPKQVIHFEPVKELYGWSLRDFASRINISVKDYQESLLTTLKRFEKKNLLHILDAYRLGYSASPFNETSLIRWVPN